MTGHEQTSHTTDLIISLLGRIAFKNDDLKRIVQRGSKKPNEILQAYNSCDGKTTITEISRKAHIAQPSLTIGIAKWERQRILLKKKSGNEVIPLGLFRVE